MRILADGTRDSVSFFVELFLSHHNILLRINKEESNHTHTPFYSNFYYKNKELKNLETSHKILKLKNFKTPKYTILEIAHNRPK